MISAADFPCASATSANRRQVSGRMGMRAIWVNSRPGGRPLGRFSRCFSLAIKNLEETLTIMFSMAIYILWKHLAQGVKRWPTPTKLFPLTNAESVQAGIGPICAAKFGF